MLHGQTQFLELSFLPTVIDYYCGKVRYRLSSVTIKECMFYLSNKGRLHVKKASKRVTETDLSGNLQHYRISSAAAE